MRSALQCQLGMICSTVEPQCTLKPSCPACSRGRQICLLCSYRRSCVSIGADAGRPRKTVAKPLPDSMACHCHITCGGGSCTSVLPHHKRRMMRSACIRVLLTATRQRIVRSVVLHTLTVHALHLHCARVPVPAPRVPLVKRGCCPGCCWCRPHLELRRP